MLRAPAIIDTNVVVAGPLTTDCESLVTRMLNGMPAASFPFVVSEALVAEYRVVPLRSKLIKLHWQSVGAIDSILTDRAQHAIVLKSVTAPPALGPDDQLLSKLLAARADLVLLTGDQLLLADCGMQRRVIGAADFVGRAAM